MNSSASASATTPTAGPKVVRIWVTDADATDSSSDEDEPPFSSRPIVKKYVTEIRLQPFRATDSGIRNGSLNGDKKRKGSDEAVAAGKKKESDSTTKGGGGKVKKFRGVRQRPSGKWAAEIRVPSGRSRMWLGTYNTAEEAAMVYDHAAIQLRGPNAFTNFTVPPESTSSGPVDEPQKNIGN